MSSIGIFIKTCEKDHKWLKSCLLSIKQNVLDFDGVCIVTDSNHSSIKEYNSIIKDINADVKYLDLPPNSHSCQDGIGYLWMQNIKLNWHELCGYDAVLQIDSDCVVSSILTPKYFIDNNDKYRWFVRSWATSKYGIIHRKPLQKLLGTKSKYEHMPFNGWVLNRSDTESFHKWMQLTHKCTWWDYLLNKTLPDWGKEVVDSELKASGCAGKSRGSSIYNAYGGFIEATKSDRYLLVDTDESPINHHPIKQYWSWGGLEENEAKGIQKELSDSNIQNIIKSPEISSFDEGFYVQQNPSSYQCIDFIPSNLNGLKISTKQKLFYHYKLLSCSVPLYLNRSSYEYHLFGDIEVDTDFDHEFYAKQYPESLNYFSTTMYPVSIRKRLYHHYLVYGVKSDPSFCKNGIELAKKLTNIFEDIPEWFTEHSYLSLCPEAKEYYLPMWENIPQIYRLYHHYLNYGRSNYKALLDSYNKSLLGNIKA